MSSTSKAKTVSSTGFSWDTISASPEYSLKEVIVGALLTTVNSIVSMLFALFWSAPLKESESTIDASTLKVYSPGIKET